MAKRASDAARESRTGLVVTGPRRQPASPSPRSARSCTSARPKARPAGTSQPCSTPTPPTSTAASPSSLALREEVGRLRDRARGLDPAACGDAAVCHVIPTG